MSHSKSPYMCERCGLPVRQTRTGWWHSVNMTTKGRECEQPVPVPRSGGRRMLKAGSVVTIWRPAGTVTIDHYPFRQKFGAHTFDYLVDKAFPFRRGTEVAAWTVVKSVEVASDGSGVLLTLEVIDSAEEQEAA